MVKSGVHQRTKHILLYIPLRGGSSMYPNAVVKLIDFFFLTLT